MTVVITGAGRGLGAALALVLADQGYTVILCARSAEALRTVAAQIKVRTQQDAEQVVLDLADAASIEAAAAQIQERFAVIDILINNGAAWLSPQESPYTAAEVTAVVGGTVTGTFLFTQALLPALEKSTRPDVLTIGSVTGLPNATLRSGSPSTDVQGVSVPFYAAKHGQVALAEGLRQALAGTPIRSICIHPPYLEDISPLDVAWEKAPERPKGAYATNRDVVEAVLFALTRPRHITIASLVIDTDAGGISRL